MAEHVVLWYIIQSWVVVRHNPGCMLAGLGSRFVQVDRLAVARQEAAEGTLAVRGRMQPDCKALG